MSLMSLPLELLEILLLYLGISDLINVLEVLGVEGSQVFWKEVCKRHGFKGDETCWKTVFQRHINWFTRKFVKREYHFPESKETLTSPGRNKRRTMRIDLHQNNILLERINGETQVWNIDNSPKMVQSLHAEHLTFTGSKLVTQNSTETCIYEYKQKSYHKLMTTSNISLDFYAHISLTDDFFVAFMVDLQSIKVINLNNLHEFVVSASNTKVGPFSKLILCEEILNVALIEASKYVLKRFDLSRRAWLSDLILFQGAALISFPEIKLNSTLITSSSSLLEYRGMTPLKIWSTNGDLIKSLPVEFIRSFGTHAHDDESIDWMVAEDYIIFSTSDTSLSFWTSQNSDMCKELQIAKYSHSKKIVSNSLLILHYRDCFKAIDYKKCVYLYEVRLDLNLCAEPLHICHYPCVNDYFYVCITETTRDDKRRATKTNMKELTTSQGNLEIDDGKCYTIKIYDYR